jgi:hypothetical protein
MGKAGYFPGVKLQEREADYSPPTSTKVKKMWIYISTFPYAFFTSSLDIGEWSASLCGLFTPGELDPGTHCKGV